MNDSPNVLVSLSPVALAEFGAKPASGYWRVWFLMFLPPFLLALISFSYAVIVVTIAQGDRSVIGPAMSQAVPYIILINHSLLLCLTYWFMKLDKISYQRIGWPASWRLRSGLGLELMVGVVAGCVLFLVHQYLSSPMVRWILEGSSNLRVASDSAPLGSNTIVAITIGIILGGFVEEQLYRGYALVRLTERIPLSIAVLPMLFSFGLLHFGLGWSGVLVATTTGLTLTLLFVWRKSLVSVVLAHALINVLVLAT